MAKIISQKFFKRPALEVAEELLGLKMVREFKDGTKIKSIITEVEAYVGEKDLACHASRGKTERTKIMYEEGGVFYVYLVYGMHHMLNIVASTKDDPQAVLIRGVKEINGPGRISKYFDIDIKFNGKKACKETKLWIEEGEKTAFKIEKTKRIGVDYAGVWANKPYRFCIKI